MPCVSALVADMRTFGLHGTQRESRRLLEYGDVRARPRSGDVCHGDVPSS